MLLLNASCIALSSVLCGLLLCGLIPKLSLNLLDKPNARSSHREPTPRGGGLAFVIVSTGFSLIAIVSGAIPFATSLQPVLPLVALPLAIIGLLDDRWSLPASWRYAAQLVTAFFILWLSPMSIPWLLMPPLIVTVTAIINFTNFMDGLDGLVPGCMAVALSAVALKLSAPWPIWALVGALIGFLFWNWSPAKVFMGDVGSTFLGAVFAGLLLQAPSWSDAVGLLLVTTPLLGDACFCVPRRLLAGHRVFKAHRLHLFQRLHQAGWPHARVSSFYIVATAALAVAFLAGGLPCVVGLAIGELLAGIWLDQNVALPFVDTSSAPSQITHFKP